MVLERAHVIGLQRVRYRVHQPYHLIGVVENELLVFISTELGDTP